MKRAYRSKKESTLLMLSFIKTSGFLFILFSLLVLSVCLNPSSQNPIVAQSAVGFIDTELQYTLSIVQTKGSSIRADEKTIYSGTFDLVIQNDKGTETSRRSLNQSFGNKDLLFDGPVNLILNDYNNDNLLDIPIGLPVNDGSGEYKYHIFSVGKDGKIFSLPIKGYKEEGFVYTAAGSYSIEFTRTGGIGEGKSPGIVIGVKNNGGGFEPAKYVWDGKLFKFEKESPFIISKAVLDANNDKYLITVIQTEYKKPLTPDEQGFSIFESMYRGRFDLQIQNSSGKVTSRVSLNNYFGNDELSCGTFPLVFKDYNKDGHYDFAIGRPGKSSPEFQYVLLSVNGEGIVYNLPAIGYKEDGFIYSAETQAGFSLLDDGETSIGVTLSNFNGYGFGYGYGKYLWNGSQFVFSDKASIEKSDGVTKIYQDKRFDFSVEYPVEWTAIMETYIEPTAEHNASPDSGINIYVDGKQVERIYVFGQVSHIRPTIDGFHREEFTTNSGLKGHLYSDEIDGKRHIDLILGEGYHGANVRISPECFNQNKERIMEVLKSIKI
ncbi:hypothetical protein E4K67_18460 [Desulfosporosinus fructosivorans]|uniref:Uncharacterized protein n=1 Tax=Desulfosporosinus fructosivorans TaxID=2018669 RepID=A0A4Z0R2R4_9FIRM|nr:hypothetical protein [Desulfosporosinus fructosivorans]TGE37060.1 hypothetical protein E4K67_18460 [Desulfosporosinus fructosivorans]